MPRFLVERTFNENIDLPGQDHDDQSRQTFIDNNAIEGVTWVLSYIAPERMKSYCIYEAPHPEALRRAARRNNLPIDRITEVSVLDPFSYRPDQK